MVPMSVKSQDERRTSFWRQAKNWHDEEDCFSKVAKLCRMNVDMAHHAPDNFWLIWWVSTECHKAQKDIHKRQYKYSARCRASQWCKGNFFRPDYNSQIAASIWVPIYYLSLQRQKKMEHLMLVGLGRVRNFMRQVKVWYFHFRMSQVSKKIRVFSVSRVESGNKFSSYESGRSATQPPSY